MQSLTRLIRDAAADNPLARALEAILDSGMIIFSRDNEGRFVQLSEKLTERAGLIAPAGASQPRNMRVFNSEGRLLAGSEYPASITRRTGAAQRDVLTRVVSDDDRHLWLQLSTMPPRARRRGLERPLGHRRRHRSRGRPGKHPA